MPSIYYYGTGSYYDCNASSTACSDGPCNADSYHLAYPNVVGHPPDYTAGCGGSVAIPRSTQLEIVNFCTGNNNNIPIDDHGPGASCRLDYVYCYPGYNYAFRFLDLTRVAFLVMGGNLATGYFPLRMGYSY